MRVKTRRLAILGSVGVAIGVLPAAYRLVHENVGFANPILTAVMYVGVAVVIAFVVVGGTILVTSLSGEEAHDGTGGDDVRRRDVGPPVRGPSRRL